MSHRNTLSRLAVASLAAASFAAPAAAQPMDMHASTVHKPKPAKVDLRGEAAAGAAVVAAKPRAQDLRGEAAAAPAISPETRSPLPGPPTWPAYPTALPKPEAPVVVDADDGGIEVPEAILAIVGTLALGAGMAVVVLRHRPRTNTAL